MDTNYLQITINNVNLPTPSEYNVTISDLDAEGQRPITTGILHRKRIRSGVLKIELTYLLKDMPNIATVLNMIQPETIAVALYDPVGGQIASKTMYAGDKKFGYKRLASGIKGEAFSFSLVEV